MKKLSLSVVISTFNRGESLKRLFEEMNSQSLPKDSYEIIIVDDGSDVPVENFLAGSLFWTPTKIIRQKNLGPAMARQMASQAATGDILVFVDDDMSVSRHFLEEHYKIHKFQKKSVVYGKISPSKRLRDLPVFERYHAKMLNQLYQGYRSKKIKPRGIHLCTGNVSVPRELFNAAGGFDTSLRRSEDRELGIRLEKCGAAFVFSELACARHDSDHRDLSVWMNRAKLYGTYDQIIFEKHPECIEASPWRFLRLVNPLSKPLLKVCSSYPWLSDLIALAALKGAAFMDRLQLTGVAIKLTTFAYGALYFGGVGRELKIKKEPRFSYKAYLKESKKIQLKQPKKPLANFIHAVLEDHRSIIRYRKKYHNADASRYVLLDLIVKIGFQMMVAYRLMRLFRESGVPLLPMLVSRLIRHLYSAEIHWDATLEPGVSIVHGNGLVLGKGSYVSKGCILFHNVTLGEGIDVASGQIGYPHLEADVHVGPGATMLGPIKVGAFSKVAAGCVVQENISEKSVVYAAKPEIRCKREPVIELFKMPSAHEA